MALNLCEEDDEVEVGAKSFEIYWEGRRPVSHPMWPSRLIYPGQAGKK
jgi:hypothetical protein